MYEPLRGAHRIRLLQLYTDASGPLRGKIRQFRIDEAPAYDALSYVWGRSEEHRYLICNEQKISITDNLHDALLHLRQKIDYTKARLLRLSDHKIAEDWTRSFHPQSNQSPQGAGFPYNELRAEDSAGLRSLRESFRLVWIDAICINQADDKEKEQQIQLMNKIYGSASNVLIWLGKEPQSIDVCQRLTEKLINLSYGAVKSCMKDGTIVNTPERISQHKATLPPAESPEWQTLAACFHSIWFFRVWTAQELLMNVFRAHIIRGSYHITWRDFEAITAWSLILGIYEPLRFYLESFLQLNNYRTLQMYGNLTAVTLFQMLTGRTTTDARDNVFGIIGLLREHLGISVECNYQKPLFQIYAEAVKQCISFDKNLQILRLIEPVDKSTQSNSWIPDFRHACAHSMDPTQTFFPEVYAASGNSRALLRTSPAANLICRGITCFRISKGAGRAGSRGVLALSIPSHQVSPSFDRKAEQQKESIEIEVMLMKRISGMRGRQSSPLNVVGGFHKRIPDRNYYNRNDLWSLLTEKDVISIIDSSRKLEFEDDEHVNPTVLVPALAAALGLDLQKKYRGEEDVRSAICATLASVKNDVVNAMEARNNGKFDTSAAFNSTSHTQSHGTEAISQSSLINKKLVLSEDGNFMALVPRSAMEGDEVCLLLGSRVPFVVRALDDTIDMNFRNLEEDLDELRRLSDCTARWAVAPVKFNSQQTRDEDSENLEVKLTALAHRLKLTTVDALVESTLEELTVSWLAILDHEAWEINNHRQRLAGLEAISRFESEPRGYEKYSIIGECYVHGIMNGQFYDEAKRIYGDPGVQINSNNSSGWKDYCFM